MRDSAFGHGDRFGREAFTKLVGKTRPLLFGDDYIGQIRLISVIHNEGMAQAVFDFELLDEASINYKTKQKAREFGIVVDKQPCDCRCCNA